MSSTTKKNNNRVRPDFIENLFAPDAFLGITPQFVKVFGKNSLGRIPLANELETDENYQVELAAPGLLLNDFGFGVSNGVLTISVEKEIEPDIGKTFKRQEFSFHAFSRSLNLPENLLCEKMEAKYENGIFLVTIPKKKF